MSCRDCQYARVFASGSVHCRKFDIPKYNTTKCVTGRGKEMACTQNGKW